MKIMHICLASSYTEGMAYQDNLLPDQNAVDGHEVLVASDCTRFENGVLTTTPPEDKLLPNGIRLVRLPFDFIFTTFISDKIRKTKLLKPLIYEFYPDVILFHGLCAWELLTVAQYKQEHPKVRFYTDSHGDFGNSAKNFLSKNILHRIYYRLILRKAYPQIDKIFLINLENEDFIKQMYGLPSHKMEYISPGGFIPNDDDWSFARQKIRGKLGLSPNDVLFVHSGKLDRLKRTEELLRAFSSVKDSSFHLVIIGSIPNDMQKILLPLIEADGRIQYLGWKLADELIEYLCACDLYVQPGSQSATMNTAMCCKAPVMLQPRKNHQPFLNGNGWFVESEDDIARVFAEISGNPQILKQMSENSTKIVCEILDFKKIAARLYD